MSSGIGLGIHFYFGGFLCTSDCWESFVMRMYGSRDGEKWRLLPCVCVYIHIVSSQVGLIDTIPIIFSLRKTGWLSCLTYLKIMCT